MATRCYLQHLLCCGNISRQQGSGRDDYENIRGNMGDQHNNPNYESTFDLFEDVFRPIEATRTSPKFTLESNGYYYSRQAESGSKYLLLGMMPDRELIAGDIKIDLMYSCIRETPGVKLQITGIHQKYTSEKSLYKFKIKLLNIEVDDSSEESPGDTVCHVDSKFLSTADLKRHLFKMYSYNGGNLQNLQLRVEVYHKRNKKCIKSEYLGKAKFSLEELDPTGESVLRAGVLLRRDWKIHRNSSS